MIGKQVLAFGKSEKSEFINIGIFAASSGGRKGRRHIGRFTPDRERSHVCKSVFPVLIIGYDGAMKISQFWDKTMLFFPILSAPGSPVVSPVSRFARVSFRPWVVSPWVVSPRVVSPVGRFAPIWWVVSPLFFIKAPRLEPGHVWRYLRWPGLSHDNF